jgi:hypothetical protein
VRELVLILVSMMSCASPRTTSPSPPSSTPGARPAGATTLGAPSPSDAGAAAEAASCIAPPETLRATASFRLLPGKKRPRVEARLAVPALSFDDALFEMTGATDCVAHEVPTDGEPNRSYELLCASGKELVWANFEVWSNDGWLHIQIADGPKRAEAAWNPRRVVADRSRTLGHLCSNPKQIVFATAAGVFH